MPMAKRMFKKETLRFGQRNETKRNLLIKKPSQAWILYEQRKTNKINQFLLVNPLINQHQYKEEIIQRMLTQ